MTLAEINQLAAAGLGAVIAVGVAIAVRMTQANYDD
jgi:hypothetical protein